MNAQNRKSHEMPPFHAVIGVFCLVAFAVLVPPAARADVSPEQFAISCNPGVDDTGCWQAAIANASPSPPFFGTVAGSAGKSYTITSSLVVCNTYGGTIDGHGAVLYWKGNSSSPVFLNINNYQLRIQNLTIIAQNPLQSGLEFTGTSSTAGISACAGAPLPASKNSVVHVRIDGNTPNNLQYGIRFSNRYSYDANNDMSLIEDVTLNNVWTAAISVEHTQSQQHRLIDVNGSGATGNSGNYINAQFGSISSVGGYQGGWGGAVFNVNGTGGPFDFINPNSEGSSRLIQVGNPHDAAGYPVVVNLLGGRFATNAVASDGNFVSFNRLGNLTVKGLWVSGTPPSGTKPAIAIQPSSIGSGAAVSADVSNVTFFVSGSDQWPTVVASSFAQLNSFGNVCYSALSYVVACAAPLRD